MSGTAKEIDDFDSLDLDIDASENFMVTFAAVGALVLLEMDDADAATPTLAAPISNEEAEQLLRGGPAPVPASAVIAPVTTDEAFVAAIAALSPTSGSAPVVVVSTDNSGFATDVLAPPGEQTPTMQADTVSTWGSSVPDFTAAIAALDPSQLFIAGDNLVVALASGVTLTIGGENDVVFALANDTINVLSGSSVAVQGGGAKVNLAGADALSLTGSGYQVQSHGGGNVVNVQQDSQATVTGDDMTTDLIGANASATVLGSADQVTSTATNTTLNIGGNGQAGIGGSLATADSATLVSGDMVNVSNSSTLAAYGVGQANLGANDFMLIGMGGAFEVFAPEMVGALYISDFGNADMLHLHSTYADIANLLGAATQSYDSTTLYLDNSGDRVTFAGVNKTQLSSFASAGKIDLY